MMFKNKDLFENLIKEIENDANKTDSQFNGYNPNRKLNRKRLSNGSSMMKIDNSTNGMFEDTFVKSINDGYEICNRNKLAIFLSSITAGFYIGFSIMCIGFAVQISVADPVIHRLIQAFFYPSGFILCIMSGSILFTEQSALAFYPYAFKKISLGKVFSFWAVVVSGNILGAFFSAFILTLSNDLLEIKMEIILLGHHLVSYSSFNIFISSVLAGILMAHGGWMIKTPSSSLSRILYITLITFIIGLGGFHHAIAGSVKIFYLLLNNIYEINYMSTLGAFILMFLGNLFGGVFFVALSNCMIFINFKKKKSLIRGTELKMHN